MWNERPNACVIIVPSQSQNSHKPIGMVQIWADSALVANICSSSCDSSDLRMYTNQSFHCEKHPQYYGEEADSHLSPDGKHTSVVFTQYQAIPRRIYEQDTIARIDDAFVVLLDGFPDLVVLGCETAKRDDREETKDGAGNHHGAVEESGPRALTIISYKVLKKWTVPRPFRYASALVRARDRAIVYVRVYTYVRTYARTRS